jgi:hypothetical protein
VGEYVIAVLLVWEDDILAKLPPGKRFTLSYSATRAAFECSGAGCFCDFTLGRRVVGCSVDEWSTRSTPVIFKMAESLKKILVSLLKNSQLKKKSTQ